MNKVNSYFKFKSLLVIFPLIVLGLSSCGTDSNESSIEEQSNEPTSSNNDTSNDNSSTTSQAGKTYTVIWKNYNGTVLETDRNVIEGSTPQYNGANPTRSSDNKFIYSWSGWTPSITSVTSDQTYTATFSTTYTDEYAYSIGMKPLFNSNYTKVTYGLYPQTNVNNSSTINALNSLTTPQANGWYLYNDEYYAKLVATPRANNYRFDNGTTIVTGTTYWFKCEPIEWTVLTNASNEYYLLSSVILDIHAYHSSQDIRIIGGYQVCPNDYEDSDMRAWLNSTFYNTAFNLNNSYIMTTLVDNSASSTHSEANSYWSNNTLDKVFLPSYQDLINTSYGFTSNREATSTRQAMTTDYTRAKGIYYSTVHNPYKGSYWSRSPDNYYNSSYNSWVVSNNGQIGFDGVDYAGDGVRAAITLKIS